MTRIIELQEICCTYILDIEKNHYNVDYVVDTVIIFIIITIDNYLIQILSIANNCFMV